VDPGVDLNPSETDSLLESQTAKPATRSSNTESIRGGEHGDISLSLRMEQDDVKGSMYEPRSTKSQFR
jgi:hypothetical protein